LVTFQFVISVFLVVTTIVLVKQIRYIESRPLGYETSNLIDVTADGDLPARFDLFRSQVATIPGVVNLTASSSNLIGVGNSLAGLDWPGKTPDQDFSIGAAWVQYDWTKTAGLTLVEGRDFGPEFGADSSTCLINQTAARKMGLKEPWLGTKVGGKTVVGVLQDFVFNGLGKAPQPLIVYLGKENLNHFLIRLTNDGQWKAHLSQIEQVAKSLNPGYPFTFQFTDDEHQDQFKKDFGTEQLANIFAVMAILISCLGLFGLASFLVEKRTKEISIRKVLGASPADLWLSLSTEMLKPVVLGFIVATPLAVMALSAALSVSDYHIRLSWWFFAVAGVGAVLIALATVSYHGIRATRINPAKALQTE
jgi:putative ABC transport system permease protein